MPAPCCATSGSWAMVRTRPSAARALIVAESEPVAVDRDEVLLIEDWRLRPDGTAVAPGTDPGDATAVYTVNGQTSLDIAARLHERLRLRFINGCQRHVIAVKMEGSRGPRDGAGQPARRSLSRRATAPLVLAPGSRADVFIDAAMAAGPSSSILLHDGIEARPIGRLVVSREPPLRDAPWLPAARAALQRLAGPARARRRAALRDGAGRRRRPTG